MARKSALQKAKSERLALARSNKGLNIEHGISNVLHNPIEITNDNKCVASALPPEAIKLQDVGKDNSNTSLQTTTGM